MLKFLCFGLLAIAVVLQTGKALEDSKPLSSLTNVEKASTVESLRQLLKTLAVEAYMLEDYYLENWLNLHNFNVEETFEIFKEFLQWRLDFNVTGICNEDWTSMRAKFPFSLDTVDKTGRPVAYWDLKDWDILAFLAEGDLSPAQYERYTYLQLEEAEALVRRLRAAGKDVRQFVIVINLGGFSLSKHVSMQSLQLFRTITTRLSHFGKVHLHKTIFINAPILFKATYYFLGNEISAVEVFGQDKSSWETSLSELISKDQFPNGMLAELPASQIDNSAGLLQWNKEL